MYKKVRVGEVMKKWVLSIIVIAIITGIAFYAWADYIITNVNEPKADGSNDIAIVLGAKVEQNGAPSLTLLYRLQETVKYMETYPHVSVIVSGGQGEDEPASEADVMYTYLVEAGIDEYRIIREDQATSTYENLLFSKELLPEGENKVTLITSDFHIARAKLLAEKLDLEVDVVAAKTPKVVEDRLHFREKLALVKALVFNH